MHSTTNSLSNALMPLGTGSATGAAFPYAGAAADARRDTSSNSIRRTAAEESANDLEITFLFL